MKVLTVLLNRIVHLRNVRKYGKKFKHFCQLHIQSEAFLNFLSNKLDMILR